MPDRRTVDELSIEELEEVVAIRKREARQARLNRLRGEGRVIDVPEPIVPPRPEPAARDVKLNSTQAYYRSRIEDDPRPRWHFTFRLSRSALRTWRDRFLLLVEVSALVGLAFVIVGLEQSRLETNQVAVETQVVPTLEPTPLIGAVVLPSGHRPPTDPGGAAPNLDEVPAHLRSYVQSVTPQPIPTPGPGQPTRIQIPAINVDAVIVEGDTWEQLKKGIGHHPGTANPGERGNLVLSAHNDIFGEYFRYLDQLKAGDEVVVYSGNQRFRYVVSQSRFVTPTQVDVMLPTSDPTVTLISCYPYLVDNKRIAVFAQWQP
jgi:sortase A